MKGTMTHGRKKLAVLLFAAGFVAAWAAGQLRRSRDRAMVTNMMGQKQTVCVGRFLVDLPTATEFSLSGERIAGFEIDTVEESKAAFTDRVAAREAEIRAHDATDDRTGEGGMIDAHNLPVPSLFGRSFIYGRSRGYLMDGDRRIDMESVSVESHAHLKGLSFTLSATSVQEDRVKEAEALLARLQVRGENEIPSAPGFCIWRAVFAEPLPKHKSEWITLHVGLPGHPDVGMAFGSAASASTDSTLLERIEHTDAEARIIERLRVTKLRSGKRSINGIDGEEEIERVRELNFTTGYSFVRESQGSPDDLSQPYLLMNMETGTNPRPGGRPVKSSLDEDAALALWDYITLSIRRRPTRVIPSVHESKPVPFSDRDFLQSDNNLRVSSDVMSDKRELADRTRFKLQTTWSLAPNSIAKLVSTLP
ncbi:T6SS immunity protein Tli4 family protein [Massilia rhizosphaerae]|uniref:T6SS immunity protein Tli4 family protein n=1 Tax=Massilia rhizosphaerae TaxID=2784389 RepID=UPI0018DC2BBF|nr:T6SS immunity protein Tli4 family protein [Massilia rhizosphaerae]